MSINKKIVCIYVHKSWPVKEVDIISVEDPTQMHFIINNIGPSSTTSSNKCYERIHVDKQGV